MGLGGISVWQLLIIFAIVVMVFGTKKLRNMGSDIGGAVKGFKSAMKDEKDEKADEDETKSEDSDDADSDDASSKDKENDSADKK